jgi:uncharacterized protein YrrD
MLEKSKTLLSMRIISLEEGQQIGRVRGIVVDPESFSIAALVTDKQGWFGDYKVVPFSKVMSIGDHAITIDKKSSIEKPSNLPEIARLMKGKQPLLGAKVFSESGTLLGIVDELLYNKETGVIDSLEISGRFLESVFRGRISIPASAVKIFGRDAIIVDNNYKRNMRSIDSPAKTKLDTVRSSGKKLFGSTKKATKKLSKSLTDSIDEFTENKEQKKENEKPEVNADENQKSDNGKSIE